LSFHRRYPAAKCASLGDIKLKKGGKDAETLLQRSIELRSDIRIAHFDLGISESDRKNYDAAVRQFERAIALDPDQADAHYRLARLYIAMGRKTEGEAQLKVIKELHADRNRDLIVKITGPDRKPKVTSRQ
jgi:tetratricopeptide (TPR) repeat protein